MFQIKSKIIIPAFLVFVLFSINGYIYLISHSRDDINTKTDLQISNYQHHASDIIISRSEYANKLYGFWLGQSIGNWTGLGTEMDKIGDIGEIKTGDFYTRDDWGKPDQPNIWSKEPSTLSPIIDFVFADVDSIWGSDDDTDIEYMYQYLHSFYRTSLLNGDQIRDGWLNHIKNSPLVVRHRLL